MPVRSSGCPTPRRLAPTDTAQPRSLDYASILNIPTPKMYQQYPSWRGARQELLSNGLFVLIFPFPESAMPNDLLGSRLLADVTGVQFPDWPPNLGLP